jgi:hypothetical protein
MCLWSIVVGEIMDQLVTAGAFQQQINVWGWNQQPIPIINQWKFATNKKMSSLWVASFSKSRGFFPQQNHQITRHTSQALRGVRSCLGTCSDGWVRILKCQSELVKSHNKGSRMKPRFQVVSKGFYIRKIRLDKLWWNIPKWVSRILSHTAICVEYISYGTADFPWIFPLKSHVS